MCLCPDCLFGGFTARLERTLAITDESKREKKLSQTCTHTAASSYLLLPRQTEALRRNSSFTVEVNIFVPILFFFSTSASGRKGGFLPTLSQCDSSSLCPAGSVSPPAHPSVQGRCRSSSGPPVVTHLEPQPPQPALFQPLSLLFEALSAQGKPSSWSQLG